MITYNTKNNTVTVCNKKGIAYTITYKYKVIDHLQKIHLKTQFLTVEDNGYTTTELNQSLKAHKVAVKNLLNLLYFSKQ